MAAGGSLPAHVPRVIVRRRRRLPRQDGDRLLVAAEEEQDSGKKVIVVARVARVEPLGEFDRRRAQLGTTDDCGFSPFADDTSTARETAFAKIRARVLGTALAADALGIDARARGASGSAPA